jgi:[acyl-carrier-protein] S-malonyltransferase
MVAYLFAGQGTQYAGMGKDLYDTFPESKAIFDRADKAAGFSVSRTCFEGTKEELTRTENSQPAILTVTIAALEAFKKSKKPQGSAPSYVAGLSLGEYSALVAAGVMGFEDTVNLVRRRGQFMEEEARRNPGGMLAVIGLETSAVRKICVDSRVEMANLNCPGQIVVSGGLEEIRQAKAMAEAQGAKQALLLEVSGAFHSSFMKGASLKLAKELEKVKISAPLVPVVSNVTGKPMRSSAEIKEALIKQVSSSVLWEESMRFILSQGVKDFIEFGPGKVLRGLLRRIDGSAAVTNIERKADLVPNK